MMPRLSNSQKIMYGRFVTDFPFCMACGCHGKNDGDEIDGTWPVDYYRHLENAHIVGGSGRVAERGSIVRLCKLCHDLSHDARIRDARGDYLPRLDQSHLLWLKYQWDRESYHRPRLQELSRLPLPRPAVPPPWFFRRSCRNLFQHHQVMLDREVCQVARQISYGHGSLKADSRQRQWANMIGLMLGNREVWS